MFDADYFRTTLARDVNAMGGSPLVEIHLDSGQVFRARSVIEVGAGSVTLEAYHAKGDLAHDRPVFGAAADDVRKAELFRAVVAYESIAAVVVDPSQHLMRARPGFTSA